MRVSIIIPAYNEERRFKEFRTLERYSQCFEEKRLAGEIEDFEILVVLNNCKDNTLQVVKDSEKKFKEIQHLEFKQGGKGFAIIEGFKDALKRKNDLIGFVDADMATSPEAYYELVKNINENDGIIASRWLKESKVSKRSFSRKILSVGFNFAVRSLFMMSYKDTQCGAKLFKREVIKKILPELSLTRWAFDVNILYACKRNNLKIKELATVWQEREGSKLNIIRVPLQMFSGIVRLRLIYSPIEPLLRPLKFVLKPIFKFLK